MGGLQRQRRPLSCESTSPAFGSPVALGSSRTSGPALLETKTAMAMAELANDIPLLVNLRVGAIAAGIICGGRKNILETCQAGRNVFRFHTF
jgi:hypothetical protein